MEKSTHISAEAETAPKTVEAPARASFGERAFNWLTYGAWNHGVNLVLSALVTYFVRGSRFHSGAIAKMEKIGIAENAGKVLLDTTLLSMGGHITAMGVKPLEDRKEQLVKAINTGFSPDEADAPIVDTRKQTWFSVLSGRAVTWALVTMGMVTTERLVGKNAQGISRFDVFQDTCGKAFAKLLRGGTHANVDGAIRETRRFKLGKVLSLELIAVTLGSVLFLVTSKFLAKKEPELLPRKVTPQVAASNAEEIPEQVTEKTNFAERVRAQETAESLGAARA